MIFNLEQESYLGKKQQESYLGGKEFFFIRGSYLNRRTSARLGMNNSFKFSCSHSVTMVGGRFNG